MRLTHAILPYAVDLPDLPDALCKGIEHADMFFPHYYGAANAAVVAEAVAMCKECPARRRCLDWAITHDAEGIWGGKTHQQRMSLSRKRKR